MLTLSAWRTATSGRVAWSTAATTTSPSRCAARCTPALILDDRFGDHRRGALEAEIDAYDPTEAQLRAAREFFVPEVYDDPDHEGPGRRRHVLEGAFRAWGLTALAELRGRCRPFPWPDGEPPSEPWPFPMLVPLADLRRVRDELTAFDNDRVYEE
ncbi:hypothetical protein [Streptomyces geranii]|uniref:hypothetical protein n=1 Tax=Streptomyces geranii TaxID=2058923 RepID=UPI000D042C5D|nr:hypothetical protein [Streptomyces geranii]